MSNPNFVVLHRWADNTEILINLRCISAITAEKEHATVVLKTKGGCATCYSVKESVEAIRNKISSCCYK